MTSSILNFFEARSRTQAEAPRGWTNQELAEFYRVADSLNQAGMAVETDLGVSDEGEPWFAFYSPDTADVVAHFARINGRFIAAGATIDEVVDGADLREIIDRMLRTRPMLMPIGKGRSASNLLLHPAVVLTAFVATALLMVQDAEAAPLGGGNGTDGHASGSAGSTAAASEKPAKAAPTLIQKLLALGGEHAGGSKQNASEALSQGFQQIALQSAIAFAVAQIPAGTQAITSGDLLDVATIATTIEKTVQVSTVTIESLSDPLRTANTVLQQTTVIGAADSAAPVASSTHGTDDHAMSIGTIVTAATKQSLFDLTLAAREDGAAIVNAIRATPGLLEFLRDFSQQIAPQQQHAALSPADTASTSKTTDAAPVAIAVKSFEVVLTTDASHTAFLQSQLFKELFHVQSVDVVTGNDAKIVDGAVKLKFTFTPPAATIPSAGETTATAVPVASDAAPTLTAADVPPPTDTVVKTGIAIYDHIIDYSTSITASKSDAFALDLIALDNSSGHLLSGAKRIVLFDSHDLSSSIYQLSADVVMININTLHLTHDQAAAGHATETMALPNGATIELVGVLAPPPGMI